MGDDNAFIVDEVSMLRAENSRLNEENLALQDKIDLLTDVESAEEGNIETRATTTECDGLRAADELLRKELADLRGEVAQIMHALRSPDGECSDVSDTSKAKTLTTKFIAPALMLRTIIMSLRMTTWMILNPRVPERMTSPTDLTNKQCGI